MKQRVNIRVGNKTKHPKNPTQKKKTKNPSIKKTWAFWVLCFFFHHKKLLNSYLLNISRWINNQVHMHQIFYYFYILQWHYCFPCYIFFSTSSKRHIGSWLNSLYTLTVPRQVRQSTNNVFLLGTISVYLT